MDRTDLENRFNHHPIDKNKPEVFKSLGDIRSSAFNFAEFIDSLVPDSREKSLAITHLEEAVFWANAGIARNQS